MVVTPLPTGPCGHVCPETTIGFRASGETWDKKGASSVLGQGYEVVSNTACWGGTTCAIMKKPRSDL